MSVNAVYHSTKVKYLLFNAFQFIAVPFLLVWKAVKCLMLHFQPLRWQDRKTALSARD